MKINLYLFSSLFILILSYETNFEIIYSNYNENDIISTFRRSYLEIEASFGSGSNSNKYKLLLDPQSHATVIPGTDSNAKGDVQKYKVTDDFKLNMNIPTAYSEKFYSGLKGEDTIQIGNSISIKSGVSFVVAKEYSSSGDFMNKYAFLGIKNSNNDDPFSLNLVGQMKEKKLIEYPTWFLNFNSDSKGKFVLGTLPHLYDNITYNEADMSTEKYRAPCNILSVQFQEIYYGNKDDYENKKAIVTSHGIVYFTLYSRLIICTPDYGEIIHSQFFEKQIKNGNCHQSTLPDKYIYYYCEKKNSFNMSEMQNLNFVTSYLSDNMTFVFEPKDLFYEHNGNYYFLIIYKPDDHITPPDSEWNIGTIFFQKYLLAINRDENLIYFYRATHNGTNPTTGGNGTNKKYIIIIVVLSVVLLGSIGFLVFYILKIKPRKKKANELDDDFDYQSKQNEEGTSPIINE